MEHPLCKSSRYHTAHGIPDRLFFLPESVDALDHKMEHLQLDLNEIEENIAVEEDQVRKVHQEYFQYNFLILNCKSLEQRD